MKRRRSCCFLLAVMVCLGGAGEAANLEAIPVRGWQAPTTWTPTAAAKPAGSRTALAAGQPVPFIPTTPCRIADTRDGSFPAGFGPPSLVGGAAARNFAIPTGPCAGIPGNAAAYSLNFTVVAPGGTPAGGYLTVFPTGGIQPVVSTLNFTSGSILANAAVVPAGSAGGVSLFVNFSTDVIIDINGYYASALNSSQTFTINSSASLGIYGISSTGYGVAGAGTIAGVLAINSGSASGSGLLGFGYSGIGARGDSTSNVGVKGTSTDLNGVWAESTNQDGLYASGGRDGAYIQGARYGVLATSTATSGVVAGVYGSIGASAGDDSAGVKGVDTGTPAGASTFVPAGVRGDSNVNLGVFGNSGYAAVLGDLWETGSRVASGVLGFKPGATAYGVYAAIGAIGCASCPKFFVDPHPTDPGRTIHYVSLEGPEAGTYFRGTAETREHVAVIDVPDHFRWVTDEEGITVHLTAVGAMASLWVESQDLNRIVVRSNCDVRFHYIVHGIRPAFKNLQPVVEGREFAPQSPNARMLEGWPEWSKQRLIQNGTYNPDGTANLETAQRLGWDRYWPDAGKK